MRKLKKIILKLVILGLAALVLLTALYFWAGSGTLPTGKLAQIMTTGKPSPAFPRDSYHIITFNIGYLSGLTNNRAVIRKKILFETNMKKFQQLLRDNPMDIIAFQEIDFHSRRSFYINQFQRIATSGNFPSGALAINWDKRYVPFPYWPPAAHFGRVLSGQALLSRFPVQHQQRYPLVRPANHPFYYNHFYLDRLVQAVEIKLGNHELVVLNVHLEAFGRKTREAQAKQVLDIYLKYPKKYPVILLGDFNCVPPTASQQKGFSDEPEADFSGEETIGIFLREQSLKAANLDLLTFPANRPTRQLDYIFFTHNQIELLNCRVIPTDCSDHLPLLMEFRFK